MEMPDGGLMLFVSIKAISTSGAPKFDECGVFISFRDQWRALIWVFKRRYWWRLWIIQELVSNEQTWVHIGPGFAPMTSFFILADAIQWILFEVSNEQIPTMSPDEASIIANEIFATIPNLSIMVDQEFYSVDQFPGLDLERLLVTYRRHSSSNPRDKVYGLVRLVHLNQDMEGRSGQLNIDYSLSLEEVYMNVAQHIVLGSGKLEIICTPEKRLCSCAAGHRPDSRLPSWVPDWACINAVRPTWKTSISRQNNRIPILYMASNQSEAQATVSEDGLALTCRGVRLGTIKTMYQFGRTYQGVPQGGLPDLLRDILLFTVLDCQSMRLNALPYVVPIELYQTLSSCHLLSYDSDKSQYPTQEKFVFYCLLVLFWTPGWGDQLVT